MDTVFIHGLKVDTIIGCYDYEKVEPQQVIFDIDMAWDIREAGKSDELEHTLDYNAVRLRIEAYLSEQHFELVEALAENVASLIMQEFAVEGIRLRLAKPDAIESASAVGIAISRGIQF